MSVVMVSPTKKMKKTRYLLLGATLSQNLSTLEERNVFYIGTTAIASIIFDRMNIQNLPWIWMSLTLIATIIAFPLSLLFIPINLSLNSINSFLQDLAVNC
jgi:hypothetical protein